MNTLTPVVQDFQKEASVVISQLLFNILIGYLVDYRKINFAVLFILIDSRILLGILLVSLWTPLAVLLVGNRPLDLLDDIFEMILL